MKKYLLMQTLLILLMATVSSAQTIVIDRPEFESSNTFSFDINKLELSDSVTVLYCDFYYRPNYMVSISSNSVLKGKSGKVYKLLRAEGYVLDKKEYLSESGNFTFKLFAEPLEKGEESFDFIESEGENYFQIKGIKTTPKKLNQNAKQCKLTGEVIDRPYSSRLMLVKETDHQFESPIYIPIRDEKFDYVLNYDDLEDYFLVFYDEYLNGSVRLIPFSLETEVVRFRLYPTKEAYKNSVKGGVL